MKSGDIIILHDYKQDDTSWKEMSEYWQWPYGNETSFEEIEESIKENGLEEFRNKEFKQNIFQHKRFLEGSCSNFDNKGHFKRLTSQRLFLSSRLQVIYIPQALL